MKKLLTLLFVLFTSTIFSKNSITTEEVKKDLNDSKWVVVDTRSSDAFNGWKLEGAKREGHIKGATDFSANWLRKSSISKKDLEMLRERMKEKNITPENNVILYDFNVKDSELVSKFLEKEGIKNIYFYDAKDWINNTNLPMEKFANYQMLVPPSWVDDLIQGKNPEGYNNNGYKIFEVSWGPLNQAMSYVRAHLPGAIHINTDEIEEEPLWSKKSDEELIKFAKNNGININETIVLYGDDVMAPYRVATILKYIGVKDVRVINGGTEALKRDKVKMVRGSVDKTPNDDIGTSKILNKGYMAEMDDAKKAIDSPNEQLVDVRSWDEYIGKVSGYSYMDRKGRPTGSVFANSGTSSTTLENYRNIDNTMRNGNEILKLWKTLGIDPNKKLVFFCGSGWRAGEVLIYSNVLGLTNNSVYSNGWQEWSYYKKYPITVEYKK